MTDASTFHRSSTALVVQGLQNDVVTEGGALAASGAPAHAPRPFQNRFDGLDQDSWRVLRSDHDRRAGRGTGTGEGHYPETQAAGAAPRPARRTGPKRATGLSTGHRGKGQDRDPEHLIAVNRKSQPRIGRTPPPITHRGARSL